MSFELQIANAKHLKALVAAVREFADQAIVGIHPEMLKLAVMDASRSVMVHFQLPKAIFESYTYDLGDGEEPLQIAMNFEHLQHIFSTVDEEPVVLRSSNANTSAVVYFVGPPERRFTMPVLDREEMEVPKGYLTVELPYHCTIEAKAFDRLVKALAKVGEAVKFQLQAEDTLLLITHGDGVSNAEITLRSDQVPLVEALTGPAGEVRAEYTLKWLGDIMKHVAKLGENVTLAFGETLPLALNVVLENGGELGYFLAPRVEEA